MGNMPEMYNLVVNTNSPLATTILEPKIKQHKNTCKTSVRLGKLSQTLKGEALTAFVNVVLK
jgi:molecular chaperone HtpG